MLIMYRSLPPVFPAAPAPLLLLLCRPLPLPLLPPADEDFFIFFLCVVCAKKRMCDVCDDTILSRY